MVNSNIDNPHLSIIIDTDQYETPVPKKNIKKNLPPQKYGSFSRSENISSSFNSSHKQKTFVYIQNDEFGWIPAELTHRIGEKGHVIPRPSPRVRPLDDNNFSKRLAFQERQEHHNNTREYHRHSFTYDDRFSVKNKGTVQEIDINHRPKRRGLKDAPIIIDLNTYPHQTLPLQDVDENGKLILREDMCEIPYLHEASILYNLKGRFEGKEGVPYTRVGDIIISINPYRWIEGLYSKKTRHLYAMNLVWKPNYDEIIRLPPHLYEASAKAFKGLTLNDEHQSILVSGKKTLFLIISFREFHAIHCDFASFVSIILNRGIWCW